MTADWPTPPRRTETPTQISPPAPPAGPRGDRVVLVAAVGYASALALVIVGLALLGWEDGSSRTPAVVALASIGAALVGGLSGWVARRP